MKLTASRTIKLLWLKLGSGAFLFVPLRSAQNHVPTNSPKAIPSLLQKKKPTILPPVCLRLASSWSMMPYGVVSTRWPNWREGRMSEASCSMSPRETSKRGEITPHLLMRPMRSMTILPP
eukprot:15377927-Heterocapsa_arctica.AAC.1